MLENEYYSIEELINLLGLKERQSYKASRKVKQYSEGMKIEDKIWIDHWFYDRSRYEYNWKCRFNGDTHSKTIVRFIWYIKEERRGERIRIVDLLFIARDLLCSLGIMDFTEDGRDYIAYVAERVMAVLSIKLEKDTIIE